MIKINHNERFTLSGTGLLQKTFYPNILFDTIILNARIISLPVTINNLYLDNGETILRPDLSTISSYTNSQKWLYFKLNFTGNSYLYIEMAISVNFVNNHSIWIY